MDRGKQIAELEAQIADAEKRIAKHRELGGERNRDKAARYAEYVAERRREIARLKKLTEEE